MQSSALLPTESWGFANCIHEKESCNHQLSKVAKEHISVILAMRVRVEHYFLMHDHIHGWQDDWRDWGREKRSMLGLMNLTFYFLINLLRAEPAI